MSELALPVSEQAVQYIREKRMHNLPYTTLLYTPAVHMSAKLFGGSLMLRCYVAYYVVCYDAT